MKKSAKTIFTCQSCGYQSPKWLGKCPDCGGWGGFVEERQATGALAVTRNAVVAPSAPVPIDSIEIDHEQRLLTAIGEFDRVLGGGLVPGVARADRRRPRHRQIHPDAAGPARLCRSGAQGALRVRARNRSGRSACAASGSHRSAASAGGLRGGRRRDSAMVDSVKPEVLVIDSIQTMFSSD